MSLEIYQMSEQIERPMRTARQERAYLIDQIGSESRPLGTRLFLGIEHTLGAALTRIGTRLQGLPEVSTTVRSPLVDAGAAPKM
jgi:hypothetical protein